MQNAMEFHLPVKSHLILNAAQQEQSGVALTDIMLALLDVLVTVYNRKMAAALCLASFLNHGHRADEVFCQTVVTRGH